MATAADSIRTRIVAAVQSATVAGFAGVAAATWASTTFPHVFTDENALINGRNRGRLPFVEVQIDSQEYDRGGAGVGTLKTTVGLLIHTGGYNKTTARQQAESIMGSAFAAIVAANAPYFDAGFVQTRLISEDILAPGWHVLKAALEVEHSYDPTIFETT